MDDSNYKRLAVCVHSLNLTHSQYNHAHSSCFVFDIYPKMYKFCYGRPIVIPLLLPTLIPDRLAPIVYSGVVRVDNLVITWSIPDVTMMLLVTYRLTISNSSGIVVHDVMTNDTTFDASSLGLPTGAYSVKVRITVPFYES